MNINDGRIHNVSADEYAHKVKHELYHAGFSEHEQGKIDMMLSGNINHRGFHSGMDKKGLEERIGWMKDNLHEHGIPAHKIDTLHEILTKHL